MGFTFEATPGSPPAADPAARRQRSRKFEPADETVAPQRTAWFDGAAGESAFARAGSVTAAGGLARGLPAVAFPVLVTTGKRLLLRVHLQLSHAALPVRSPVHLTTYTAIPTSHLTPPFLAPMLQAPLRLLALPVAGRSCGR